MKSKNIKFQRGYLGHFNNPTYLVQDKSYYFRTILATFYIISNHLGDIFTNVAITKCAKEVIDTVKKKFYA